MSTVPVAGDDRLAGLAPACVPVSVVIATYTTRRRELLDACLASLARQTVPPDEVIVAVDHCPALAAWLEERGDVRVVRSERHPGVAGTRNAGIMASSGAYLFFLDDDAVAASTWIERLLAVFDDPAVMIAGGAIRGRWDRGRPAWFPPELDWVVGCTYPGLPTFRAPVRNVIAANMAMRRETLSLAGGFRAGIGRAGADGFGCEETELCIRVRDATGAPDVVMYEPAAVVTQYVPRERARFGYLLDRCRAEGRSKAAIARLVGAHAALAAEAVYARRVVPAAVARGLRDGLRGDGAGLLRSSALLAGLGATAAAYAQTFVRLRRSP